MIIHGVATDFTSFTNGPEGLNPISPITLGAVKLGLQATNVFLLALVAVVIYVHAALIAGRYGRAMRAVQGNETAAASLGVNVVAIKCLAFAVSGVFAGLAGAFYAPVNGFVNPDSFTMELSVLMLMMVILGGQGTIWGPVAGAIVLTLIDRLLASLGDIRLVIYGSILLATLYLMPEGLVGLLNRFRKKPAAEASALSGTAGVSQGTLASGPAQPGSDLSVNAVSRAFGGLMAVDEVTFRVAPASIHGLVGPNGAGKTTVLNLISGVIAPTAGAISYAGGEIGDKPMHVLARTGVARTFQNLALFRDMTVLENVMAGLHLSAKASFLANLLRTPSMLREEQALDDEAMSLLKFVGLAEEARRPAASLPQGHQRLLEIARALAVHPTLLLLDEPAAGLNGTEIDRLIDLIRKIRAANITVLLIEHHMQLVMAVCETITVLDFGKLIAEGPPETVRNNPQVLEAYLGKPAGRREAGDSDA
jgi:branched-chain amino acid transport system permease protein